jgi:hypothetical protein
MLLQPSLLKASAFLPGKVRRLKKPTGVLSKLYFSAALTAR